MAYHDHIDRAVEHSTYADNHPKVIKAREFSRVITSLLMAARINHADGPNKAIKAAAARLADEVTDPDVLEVCRRAARQRYPYGYVCRLARILEGANRQVGERMKKGGVK